MDNTTIKTAQEILKEVSYINTVLPELEQVTTFRRLASLLDAAPSALIDQEELTGVVRQRLRERRDKLQADYKLLNL